MKDLYDTRYEARFTSIRILFALVAEFGYVLRHMDAITAFLNGDLDAEIYMELPPGIEDFQDTIQDSDIRTKVCRLLKSRNEVSNDQMQTMRSIGAAKENWS